MTSPISALTDLAIAAYRKNQGPTSTASIPTGDAVLDGLMQRAPEVGADIVKGAMKNLDADADLAPLFAMGDAALFVGYWGFGSGATVEAIITSLIIGAARRVYVLNLDRSESTFVGLVLENYEELKRALRGEQVRAYRVMGFSGVKIPEGVRVDTAWGSLLPAPSSRPMAGAPWMPNQETTAILAKQQLVSVTIAPQPAPTTMPTRDAHELIEAERTRQLLPLAFALATVHKDICAPLATFELVLPPFGSGLGWSNHNWLFSIFRQAVEPSSAERIQAEVWSRRLDQNFPDNLQVAGRRIVSAIAQRVDSTDSLIDAVTAWESMVGTGSETSFRVTAAIARLLERDSSKRLAYRKELGEIYNLRSRAVHGEPVNAGVVTNKAKQAIEIGLKTLSGIYSKPEDWLTAKSGERADRLILED